MAIQRTAGSELWIGDRRVGGRITHFKTMGSTPATIVTGISHSRVQRRQAAPNDDGFELSGLMDPEELRDLHSTADMYFSERQVRMPCRAFRMRGRISPEDSIEHPEGDFIRLATSGYVNIDPADGHAMAVGFSALQEHQDQPFYEGTNAVVLDRGATAPTSPDGGLNLGLRVQVEAFSSEGAPGTAAIAAYHSPDASTWAAVAGVSARVDNVTPPAGVDASATVATLNRYLGLGITVSSGDPVNDFVNVTFSAMLFVSDAS